MNDMIFCQSCAMPMTRSEEFGTEKDGSKSADYCCYCYQNGEFENKDMTLEEMIEVCAPFLIEAGQASDAESARAMLNEFLPKLKRWTTNA